jgi:hypothetical protein
MREILSDTEGEMESPPGSESRIRILEMNLGLKVLPQSSCTVENSPNIMSEAKESEAVAEGSESSCTVADSPAM